MRWPWQRKRDNMINSNESRQALTRARVQRRQVESQWTDVNKASEDLAKHQRENNFSRLIEEAMHIKRGPS